MIQSFKLFKADGTPVTGLYRYGDARVVSGNVLLDDAATARLVARANALKEWHPWVEAAVYAFSEFCDEGEIGLMVPEGGKRG